jgi:hypothetical protein
MKICFFLQRRFAYLGHAMACHINAFAPDTQFCAFAQHRPSVDFIKKQTDIKYTSVVVDEDIYRSLKDEKIDYAFLADFEKEYGIPNLWPYLYLDRVIMNGQLVREYPYDTPSLSHEDMLRYLQVNAKTILAFLEKERPDSIVFGLVGSATSSMLYHVAKKKGIQTINIDFARIGNRISFSEEDGTLSWGQKRFHEISDGRSSDKREDAKKFLEEFRNAPAPYDLATLPEAYAKTGRLVALRFLQPKRLLWSIPWHIKTFFADLKKIKNEDYTDIFIWWSLWDKFKRKSRTILGYTDLYSKADMECRFAYYPLHIEPEIALMRYAPYYTNQLEVIRAIAHALPIDMLLYVKEHPGMVGYRTRSYYKEMLKIPNVRLLNPHTPGGELSKHGAITVTVTSTAAWEALILKRPVITFGDVFFNDIPGVKRCRGFEELPYLIKEQLEEWKHDEETLIDYVSALLEDSVAVYFSAMWNEAASLETILADEGMKELSRTLAERTGIIGKN